MIVGSAGNWNITTIALQMIAGHDNRRFDVVTLFPEADADDVRVVYFDVTAFFGVSETPLVDAIKRELE